MAWLGTWEKRKSITIDHLKIDADLTYFPVTVILDGDTDFFGELTSDTDKLKVAFTKSDGETQLYFDCEHFDATNNKAVYHVSKSDWTISSASDTEFYIYYDSAQSDNTSYGNVSGTSPATNVWDSSFLAVYHLANNQDATSNNYDGTAQGGVTIGGVDGKVGKATNFDGTDDYISLPGFQAVTTTGGPFTIEAVFKADTLGERFGFFCNENDADWHIAAMFGTYTDDTGQFWANWSESGTNTTTILSTGTWYYLAGTATGTSREIFLNGNSENTQDTGYNTQVWYTYANWIGRRKQPAFDHYFDGIIDEVRVSTVVRSDAWIKATYHSLFNTLLTFGSEEVLTIEISMTDSGSGVETISISFGISLTDSGSGVDTVTKSTGPTISDSGSGVETLSISTTLFLSDSGSGVDTVYVPTTISVADSGSGVDTISSSFAATISDSAIGTEVISTATCLSLTDLGSGVDSIYRFMLERVIDSGSGVDFVSKKIIYQPLVFDYEDFSRPVMISSYKTSSEVIWDNKPVLADEATDPIDISSIASLGVFIEVSSATKIKVQIYTTNGWKDYEEIVFPSAGSIFLNFWTLPFQKLRFQTTQATTATIELSYRT